jgi:hypothetical protein
MTDWFTSPARAPDASASASASTRRRTARGSPAAPAQRARTRAAFPSTAGAGIANAMLATAPAV